jgi:glutathione peroxidase
MFMGEFHVAKINKNEHMKNNFFAIAIFMITGISGPGIYDYSFTDMEGNTIALNNYRQKKIVIVTLSIIKSNENDKYLLRLDSLSKANPSVVMIGIPAVEDGYAEQNATTLKNLYRSKMGNQFIIAKGMHTRKYSENQHSLYKWLTDKDFNTHFDKDAAGAGQQFFINETGEIYGVTGPEAKWSNKIFNRLVK